MIPVLVLLGGSRPSWPESAWNPGTLHEILARTQQTLVTVECVSRVEGFGQSREVARQVNGIVVSPTGVILVPKNMEVLESLRRSFALSRPEKVQIVFQDGTRRSGSYIGADPDMKISFFRLDSENGPVANLAFLRFSTEEATLGDELISVRLLPEEFEPRQEITVVRASAVVTKPNLRIRTQPPLSRFTGFPVFTPRGSAIGIVRIDEGDPGGAEQALSVISGGVSVQPSERFLDLIRHPPLKREKGWLGIRMEPLTRDLAEIWSLPVPGGIIITDTVPGSPAERVGLEAEDILVEVDGAPLYITSYADLSRFRQEIRKKKPGDVIRMKIVRGATSLGRRPIESKRIDVTLGLSPPSEMEAETLNLPEIGMKVRDLTLDFLFAKRLRPGTKGIVAAYVERAGPADIGKISQDDVILSIDGRPVPDLAAARKLFESYRAEKPRELVFHILRNQNRLFLRITPEWD